MSDRIVRLVEPIAAVLATILLGFLTGLMLILGMEWLMGRAYFWGMW